MISVCIADVTESLCSYFDEWEARVSENLFLYSSIDYPSKVKPFKRPLEHGHDSDVRASTTILVLLRQKITFEYSPRCSGVSSSSGSVSDSSVDTWIFSRSSLFLLILQQESSNQHLLLSYFEVDAFGSKADSLVSQNFWIDSTIVLVVRDLPFERSFWFVYLHMAVILISRMQCRYDIHLVPFRSLVFRRFRAEKQEKTVATQTRNNLITIINTFVFN